MPCSHTPSALAHLSRNHAVELHFRTGFSSIYSRQSWAIFYCIAVGKRRQKFFPKSLPPIPFFFRNRQFYRRASLRLTDDSGGNEDPIAEAANGHRLLPSQFAFEQNNQVVRQDAQA